MNFKLQDGIMSKKCFSSRTQHKDSVAACSGWVGLHQLKLPESFCQTHLTSSIVLCSIAQKVSHFDVSNVATSLYNISKVMSLSVSVAFHSDCTVQPMSTVDN